MKILALLPQRGGIEYHRLYKPLMRMQIDNPEIEIFLSEGAIPPDFEGYDLVLFNRYYVTPIPIRKQGIDYHYSVIQRLAELKIPYILDLDDFWRLPKWHHATKYYKADDLTGAIKDAVQYAAGVTVTTETLASEVRRLNHNVCIIPNAIEWTDDQWAHEKQKSDKVRFGWVGGIGHENDLQIIAPAVNFIQDTYDVEFHLCGVVDYELIWHRIAKQFPKAILHKGMNANEYGQLYSNFDVMLCPLENTKFNNMKSELKMLESAEYSLPMIASNVLPYKEHSKNIGLTLVEYNEWINAMQLYIHAPSRIKADGDHNYNYCHAFFDIEAINYKRLQFYQRICRQRTNAPS
jgi:hypothetical protein